MKYAVIMFSKNTVAAYTVTASGMVDAIEQAGVLHVESGAVEEVTKLEVHRLTEPT